MAAVLLADNAAVFSIVYDVDVTATLAAAVAAAAAAARQAIAGDRWQTFKLRWDALLSSWERDDESKLTT